MLYTNGANEANGYATQTSYVPGETCSYKVQMAQIMSSCTSKPFKPVKQPLSRGLCQRLYKSPPQNNHIISCLRALFWTIKHLSAKICSIVKEGLSKANWSLRVPEDLMSLYNQSLELCFDNCLMSVAI